MKKGEISTMLIVLISLIVILLSGAIIFAMFGSFGEEIDRTTGITTVQSWLLLKVQAEDISKGFAKTSSRPPIAELSEPIIIDNKNQLASIDGEPPEAAILIGDAMADCWDAFHRGEIPFERTDKAGVFCFSCTGIEIASDEIKEKGHGIPDFKRYLNTTPVSTMDDRTYIEYLSNMNENYHYFIKKDQSFKEDLYVYFVALFGAREYIHLLTLGTTSTIIDIPHGEELPVNVAGDPPYRPNVLLLTKDEVTEACRQPTER